MPLTSHAANRLLGMRSAAGAGYTLREGSCRVFGVLVEGLAGYGHGLRRPSAHIWLVHGYLGSQGLPVVWGWALGKLPDEVLLCAIGIW